jgi:hypothetical protein
MSAKSDNVCGISSIVLAVLNGLALLVFAIGGLHVRGRFLDIYRELLGHRTLPVATQCVCSVPAWAVLMGTLALLFVLFAKERLRPKWVPLCLNLVWMLIGIVVSVLLSAIMMAPLLTIILQIPSGPP